MIQWHELPKEIQQKMLEHQEKQTGKRDESVFKKDIYSSVDMGGFDWISSQEEEDFWYEIIENGNISKFYETYPKETRSVKEQIADLRKQRKEIFDKIKELERRAK